MRKSAAVNKCVLVALCAIALVGSNASAVPPEATPIVRAAFGNTIISTYPDGRRAELWLNADGTYSARGRRHEPSYGQWKVKGSRLCLRQVRPLSFPFSYCTTVPSDPSVKQWSGKAVTGERIQITLAPGR